jgi:hypothetical protein
VYTAANTWILKCMQDQEAGTRRPSTFPNGQLYRHVAVIDSGIINAARALVTAVARTILRFKVNLAMAQLNVMLLLC